MTSHSARSARSVLAAAITLALLALLPLSPSLVAAQMRLGGPPPRVVPLGQHQVVPYVDSLLAPLAARGWFSGAVLLARDGVPLVAKAYGLADRGRGVANTVDTRFNVGSMNKMMTAVAVLQLAEAGKLALGDRVGRWLPDYPVAAVRERVTIAQLLSHRSGLGSYWNDRFQRERLKIREVSDYLALFSTDSLLSPPGTRWEYSNAGFVVLGAIIERVTGMRYEDYLRARVLRPAGMVATDFSALADSAPSRAVGYMREGGFRGAARPDTSASAPGFVPNWGILPNRGGPAGGGYTTVTDLLNFDRALRGGRLLSAAWRDSLWTVRNAELMDPNNPQQRIMPYGYGFGVQTSPMGTVVGHTGGTPGAGATFDMYLGNGYTIAILANVDGPGLFIARSVLDAALKGLEQGLEQGRKQGLRQGRAASR